MLLSVHMTQQLANGFGVPLSAAWRGNGFVIQAGGDGGKRRSAVLAEFGDGRPQQRRTCRRFGCFGRSGFGAIGGAKRITVMTEVPSASATCSRVNNIRATIGVSLNMLAQPGTRPVHSIHIRGYLGCAELAPPARPAHCQDIVNVRLGFADEIG
jgi:hypothetical protein